MRPTIMIIALLSILITSNMVASRPDTEDVEDRDYIDLFGSTSPKPEVEDTTTPPPFWESENEYDQVDMVLKREIFALFKMIYPAQLIVAAGITGLCLLVLIIVLLCIMQSKATRAASVRWGDDGLMEEIEEKIPQPLES